jgi:hypothetical protein
MTTLKDNIDKISRLRLEAKSKLNEAEKLELTFEIDANALLLEISKYEEIEYINDLLFDSIDESYIYYTGSIYTGRDYHNRDEYQNVEYELPSELLYDKSYLDNYLKGLKEEANKKIQIEIELKNKSEFEKKEKDKAKYLELKKQFENDGE